MKSPETSSSKLPLPEGCRFDSITFDKEDTATCCFIIKHKDKEYEIKVHQSPRGVLEYDEGKTVHIMYEDEQKIIDFAKQRFSELI